MVNLVGKIPLSVDGLFHRFFWYVKAVGMEWAWGEFVWFSLDRIIGRLVVLLIRIVLRIPAMKSVLKPKYE